MVELLKQSTQCRHGSRFLLRVSLRVSALLSAADMHFLATRGALPDVLARRVIDIRGYEGNAVAVALKHKQELVGGQSAHLTAQWAEMTDLLSVVIAEIIANHLTDATPTLIKALGCVF